MHVLSARLDAGHLIVLGAAVAFGLASLAGVAWVFVVLAIAAVTVVVVLERPTLGLYAALVLMPLEAAGRVVASQPALTWAKVALVGCAAALVCRALVTKERFEEPPGMWALVGLVAVSLAGSVAGGYGFDLETFKILAGTVSNIALVLLAYHLLTSERELKTATLAVIAGSVPVVAVGLVEIATKEAVFDNPLLTEPLWAPGTVDIFRITSTFYDPNALGRYLAFAMLWTLAALWLPELRRWRPALLALVAIQLYCIVNTFSRAAFLTVLVVAVPFLGYRFIHHWKAAGAAVLATGLAVASFALWPLASIVLRRFDDPTAGGRLEIVEAGLPVLARSPLLGYGREHVPAALGTVLGVEVDPHNLFLEILLAVGVVGALLGAAWALPALTRLWMYWRAGEPLARLVILPLIGVFVFGLSLHGMDGYELWIPLAFALPIARYLRRKETLKCESPS